MLATPRTSMKTSPANYPKIRLWKGLCCHRLSNSNLRDGRTIGPSLASETPAAASRIHLLQAFPSIKPFLGAERRARVSQTPAVSRTTVKTFHPVLQLHITAAYAYTATCARRLVLSSVPSFGGSNPHTIFDWISMWQ
jgi:hypothetical protein